MRSPSKLLIKFSRKLFDDEAQQEQFIAALTAPQPLHPCILWCHDPPNDIPFTVEAPQAWQPKFVDRLGLHETPGRHPWHDEGYFYCLDFSSVFAASILQAIASPMRVVFDMCASPGGKSVFAWRLFQPDLLLS
ncbi:MAG TPA: RsmB/NOP family class I SAM-dependent RNA methyltransferase, partial [Elainellaceae cyanobacterium]